MAAALRRNFASHRALLGQISGSATISTGCLSVSLGESFPTKVLFSVEFNEIIAIYLNCSVLFHRIQVSPTRIGQFYLYRRHGVQYCIDF